MTDDSTSRRVEIYYVDTEYQVIFHNMHGQVRRISFSTLGQAMSAVQDWLRK